MSGGSLEYAYSKVGYIADDVESQARTPLHKAFASHLRDVANALRDLEWVLSGDYGPGDEIESIRKVVDKAKEVEVVTENAYVALKELREALEK